jgi:hypothetical protein
MKLHRYIALPATVLSLALSVGLAPNRSPYLHVTDASSHSTNQDSQKSGAIDSPHIYTPGAVMHVCGVIPYDSYEGWANTEMFVMKCNDGAQIQVANEAFTSSRAAEKERIKRLKGKYPARKSWKIEQTVSLDEITVVELREPVSTGFEDAQSNKWVVIGTRNASLFSIYGPDREHVMDYYQRHYKADSNK